MKSPSGLARSARTRLPLVDVAVDVGFAILLIVCAARYFSRHTLDGLGSLALVLAIGAGLSYAIAIIARLGLRNKAAGKAPAGLAMIETAQGIGLLAATCFWLPLTVLAPSFAWCGFALFFAVHRVIRGWIAFAMSAAIVVAVSIGLFIMSKGDDLGLVLGPLVGGLVLASAYAALDQSLEQQQALNAELIATREQLAASERDAGAIAERGRVASELHDTVVQRTASALLLLESDELTPGESSPAVREAREGLRTALVETRQLLHGLTDPNRPENSLVESLTTLTTAAGAAFETHGHERALSEDISHALMRVTQESLTNIRKHAQAAETRVALTFFDTAVGVDIADNGIGLDPERASATDGFGLRAMQWRMTALGGELSIESRPGGGTIVAAIVPTEGPAS